MSGKPISSNAAKFCRQIVKECSLFADGKSRDEHGNSHDVHHTHRANMANCYSQPHQKDIAMDGTIIYEFFIHGTLLLVILYLWVQ